MKIVTWNCCMALNSKIDELKEFNADIYVIPECEDPKNSDSTEISNDSGIRNNHISKVLSELKEKGIVICTNEDDRKNRNYHLTDLGFEIAEELK